MDNGDYGDDRRENKPVCMNWYSIKERSLINFNHNICRLRGVGWLLYPGNYFSSHQTF